VERPTGIGSPVKVFIAGPVRVYREGLAAILDREDGVEVVGSAADAQEILHAIGDLAPDVVLVDMSAPGGARTIGELVPPKGVTVAALGVDDSGSDVISCAEAGVSAFVSSDASVDTLVAALRSAAQGELLISPKMAATLLRRVAALGGEDRHRAAESDLTRRELDVLRLLEEGLSNKEIAGRLSIELPTVKQHVHHILGKLHVSRRGEAVARLRATPR
jgi:DNA-binding NarL/FixJ family response regulator